MACTACTHTHTEYENISFPHTQVVKMSNPLIAGVKTQDSVADPGFPIGGVPCHWGVPTSDVGAFQQKHM